MHAPPLKCEEEMSKETQNPSTVQLTSSPFAEDKFLCGRTQPLPQ